MNAVAVAVVAMMREADSVPVIPSAALLRDAGEDVVSALPRPSATALTALLTQP